jgi:hypothetical protein
VVALAQYATHESRHDGGRNTNHPPDWLPSYRQVYEESLDALDSSKTFYIHRHDRVLSRDSHKYQLAAPVNLRNHLQRAKRIDLKSGLPPSGCRVNLRLMLRGVSTSSYLNWERCLRSDSRILMLCFKSASHPHQTSSSSSLETPPQKVHFSMAPPPQKNRPTSSMTAYSSLTPSTSHATPFERQDSYQIRGCNLSGIILQNFESCSTETQLGS